MVDYDLTPDGQSTPRVRLYGDSLGDIPRRQVHAAERHDVIAGAAPSADPDGLEPGDIRFEGHWLGADAGTIADTFRNDFLDDPSVEKVTVQARDSSGFISSRFNDTYLIAEESRVDKVVAQSDRNWRYRIILIED